MKTLLLKLAGPLQSWGTRSHFETRHTDFYPSKSAVIGMIAASLGIRRSDDAKMKELNALQFAVRIDQQGNLLRDYHTARKYKSNGDFDRTYVTHRYYLEDALFVVAIGHENIDWMNEIEDALKSPYYQTFMGRRSLPLPADFLIGSSALHVIEALHELPWQGYNEKEKNNRLPLYADAYLLEGQPTQMRKDTVVSFSQKERRFGYRAEAKGHIEFDQEENTTDHDAFDAIGG